MKKVFKNILFLIWAIGDLLVILLPFPPRRDGGFAFIVHPRTEADAVRKYPFARFLGRRLISLWCRLFWPVLASEVTGVKRLDNGETLRGWIMICPLTAKQMVEDRPLAKRRILQTIKLAEKYGAEVVGLGGLTSSVTQGGLELVESAQAGLVTGRALTPVIVSDFALDAMKVAGKDLGQVSAAVVGAAGAIGSASAVLIARAGVSRIILIDLERKAVQLEEVVKRVKLASGSTEVEISHDISRIREAALVVTATSAPEALITSSDVSPGTIIVDDAQPSDVHQDVFERGDVVVLTAGVIKTPGIKSHFPMSLSHDEENFSCFGEVVTLAAHGRHEDFSVGYVKDEEIEEIKKLSGRLGITRGNFQNHHRVYTDEEIRKIAGAKP